MKKQVEASSQGVLLLVFSGVLLLVLSSWYSPVHWWQWHSPFHIHCCPQLAYINPHTSSIPLSFYHPLDTSQTILVLLNHLNHFFVTVLSLFHHCSSSLTSIAALITTSTATNTNKSKWLPLSLSPPRPLILLPSMAFACALKPPDSTRLTCMALTVSFVVGQTPRSSKL